MDVSVKGEYALRAVFELSRRGQPEPVKIAKIAESQQIPPKFLELILAQLKQGGFLGSRRGVEGGYFLARRPDEITVGDILRQVDGSFQPSKRPFANEAEDSPFPEMWDRVERALSSVIDRTTFAELVERWRQKRSQAVRNWQI
ncbi:MAG: Rrf2 family transcriptional regulator [Bryobacterales bacterium]|nr:Rrf2 family transcriptional regulator [Bryobacterales bacterium]